MRVKVGNNWFECEPGRPIMVELTKGDKENIAKMSDESTKYALFSEDDDTTKDEKFKWMGE